MLLKAYYAQYYAGIGLTERRGPLTTVAGWIGRRCSLTSVLGWIGRRGPVAGWMRKGSDLGYLMEL